MTCDNNQLEMVAGTVRYSTINTMIPVPVATLYPLKYRRRYFWELELDPGAGAVDTAIFISIFLLPMRGVVHSSALALWTPGPV